MARPARRALALLAASLCGGALAERLLAPAVAPRPAAPRLLGPLGWRPRASRAAFLALAVVAAEPEFALDGLTGDMFRELDLDEDGLLTLDEFAPFGGEDVDHLQLLGQRTLHRAADIDDDDYLCLAEFEFARHLQREEEALKTIQQISLLPESFLMGVDVMFEELEGGKARFEDVLDSVRRLLMLEEGEEVVGLSKTEIMELFGRADVIRDGVLNLNELEFFCFLARDVLVELGLQAVTADAQAEVKEALVDGVFRDFDEDGDGLLRRDEILEGFRISIQMAVAVVDDSVLEETNIWLDFVQEKFTEVDADGDGVIDRDGARLLVDRLAILQGT